LPPERQEFTGSAHGAGRARCMASVVTTRRMTRTMRQFALATALACTAVACNAEPPLDVAQSVDLSRFQGKWYEIARLPRTTQTDCHGTTAFYSQGSDGTLAFVNQCNVGGPTGPLKTVSMSAKVPDPTVPAKLALDIAGYTGDYWILEVGANYEYAVVGHPSRLYFWILSRTPTLDPSTVSGVLERAQNNHFDMTQIQYTPQPPAGERVSQEGRGRNRRVPRGPAQLVPDRADPVPARRRPARAAAAGAARARRGPDRGLAAAAPHRAAAARRRGPARDPAAPGRPAGTPAGRARTAAGRRACGTGRRVARAPGGRGQDVARLRIDTTGGYRPGLSEIVAFAGGRD